jgi:hypothetical protein
MVFERVPESSRGKVVGLAKVANWLKWQIGELGVRRSQASKPGAERQSRVSEVMESSLRSELVFLAVAMRYSVCSRDVRSTLSNIRDVSRSPMALRRRVGGWVALCRLGKLGSLTMVAGSLTMNSGSLTMVLEV